MPDNMRNCRIYLHFHAFVNCVLFDKLYMFLQLLPELSMLLSVACGTIIFAFALERLGTTIEFFKGLLSKLPVEPAFFVTMVKMLGIAYIAEFSSSICKDCGHSAIASQIELFAKGAIVVMSIPVMSCLIELIGELF